MQSPDFATMLRSKLVQWPPYEDILRTVRIYALYSLAWISWLFSVNFGFILIFIIEALYNVYAFFLRPPLNESAVLARLIAEGTREKGVAVVTGATAGVGREIAQALLFAGYRVHLPVRNMEKALMVEAEFRQNCPKAEIKLYQCDIGEVEQVKRFVNDLSKSESKIDILINDAGVYLPNFVVNSQGIEAHHAVHVVGPYILTSLLRPLLKAGDGRRVITVTSSAHYAVPAFDPRAMFEKSRFRRFGSYCHAKYALNLVMLELARSMSAADGISINLVHPGMVNTQIAREDFVVAFAIKTFLQTLFPFALMSPQRGALTAIWLALGREVDGTERRYYHDMMEEPLSLRLQEDLKRGAGGAIIAYCERWLGK